MEKNKNLALWDSVAKTDPQMVRNAKIGGRTINTVDAYYRINLATSKWGSYGSTWGLKNIEYSYIDTHDGKLAFIKAKFFAPDIEFELSNAIDVIYKTSQGYVKVDSDFAKKIETDTLTKALSRLGFCADVFMGKFEDARYVGEMQKEFKKFPTASQATDEDKKGAKGILVDYASDYIGVNLKQDAKLIEMLFDELSIPKLGKDADEKAINNQYNIIVKWINGRDNLNNQLDILISKMESEDA